MCPAIRLPGTAQVVFAAEHNGDYVFNLGEYPDIDTAISQEDIVVVGNWTDYTGSGGRGPQDVMNNGAGNRKKTEAENILGNEQTFNLTDRGQSADIHRVRDKLVYVEDVSTLKI